MKRFFWLTLEVLVLSVATKYLARYMLVTPMEVLTYFIMVKVIDIQYRLQNGQ